MENETRELVSQVPGDEDVKWWIDQANKLFARQSTTGWHRYE